MSQNEDNQENKLLDINDPIVCALRARCLNLLTSINKTQGDMYKNKISIKSEKKLIQERNNDKNEDTGDAPFADSEDNKQDD